VGCILTDRRCNYDNIVFKCARLALPRSLMTSGASCFFVDPFQIIGGQFA